MLESVLFTRDVMNSVKNAFTSMCPGGKMKKDVGFAHGELKEPSEVRLILKVSYTVCVISSLSPYRPYLARQPLEAVVRTGGTKSIRGQ